MEKIEQLETLKNVQLKIAKTFGLERMLRPIELSDKEMEDRCKYQIFDSLKKEVSSVLSSLDALFNATVLLDEEYLSIEIVRFLDNLSSELHEFVESVASYYDESDEDEKGGEHEIS